MRHLAFSALALLALLGLRCASVPSDPVVNGNLPAGELTQIGVQKILYTDTKEGIQHLYILESVTGVPRRLTSTPARRQGTWSPDGRSVAYREIGADGVRSSLNLIREDGTGARQLVLYPSGPAILMFRWSPDGARIAFRVGAPSLAVRVIGVDGTGLVSIDALGGSGSLGIGLAWSPDGRTLAYEGRYTDDTAAQLYLVSGDGTGRRRLTGTASRAGSPAWSPDGRRIAFESNGQLFVINSDGTGQRQIVEGPAANPEWSPRGDAILFQILTGGLGLVNVDGTSLRQVVNSGIGDSGTARSWSPGGTRVAFLGLSDNRTSLFVVSLAGNDFRDLVDDVGSFDLRWAR